MSIATDSNLIVSLVMAGILDDEEGVDPARRPGLTGARALARPRFALPPLRDLRAWR
jgi:hypothetical protein